MKSFINVFAEMFIALNVVLSIIMILLGIVTVNYPIVVAFSSALIGWCVAMSEKDKNKDIKGDLGL